MMDFLGEAGMVLFLIVFLGVFLGAVRRPKAEVKRLASLALDEHDTGPRDQS